MPLCPYCSTPFTKDMLEVYNGTYGCETGCEYYTVSVDCAKCNKNIYKEGSFGSVDNAAEIMEVTEEEWAEIIKDTKYQNENNQL